MTERFNELVAFALKAREMWTTPNYVYRFYADADLGRVSLDECYVHGNGMVERPIRHYEFVWVVNGKPGFQISHQL